MENYRFIVTDKELQEQIIKMLLDKKYHFNIEKNIPEENLNCFFIWADGSKRCVFGNSQGGGDNTKIITSENINWFLKQI